MPRLSIQDFRDMTASFDPSRLLGEGSFGRVYLGDYRGQQVAVKKLDAGSQSEKDFLPGVSQSLTHSLSRPSSHTDTQPGRQAVQICS